MPIYMDRHNLASVTAKDVAEAHHADIKIQDDYQCKALTYWFDEERGTAFCLVEAPDAECVKKMHDHAHGLVPHHIFEVEANVVDAFLGRIEDPKTEDVGLHIISEPAYRFIMYISLEEVFVFKSKIDKDVATRIISSVREIMQENLKRYNGREVIKERKRLIVSFTSAKSAVMCALNIRNEVKSKIEKPDYPFKIKIGLSAGNPVTDQKGLFSETVQMAERLCDIADKQQVFMSSEAYKGYHDEIPEGLSDGNLLRALMPDDEKFMHNLIESANAVWNDPNFDVGAFGKQAGLSRSQFYRKVSSLTGLSPNEFIREFRLKKALDLIEDHKGNVAQIAFETGFSSPSYFSKCFYNRYGILPSIMVGKNA